MMVEYSFEAVIFDLDGVITKTAVVHASAWKAMFDSYLLDRYKRFNEPFSEFSYSNDYLPYIDGKPRYKGVESFLTSRGIKIPFGTPDDLPTDETVCGLGNSKNEAFNQILWEKGVDVYESTLNLMIELQNAGVKMGVASSSKNCKQVLERANLLHFFQTRVDGEVSATMGLKGKPEPDIFNVASDNLGVPHSSAIIIEDAVSGVQAAKKGNFGLIIGIARENNAEELFENGAQWVVTDLVEVGGLVGLETRFKRK